MTYNDGTETRTASAVKVINNANKDSDDTYTHVRITLAGTKSELDSVTTFAVTDTTLSAKYRYPYTKYIGTGTDDMTWYDSSEDKYVIATSAELYGFANMVTKGNAFAEKTIYIVSDIEVNKGYADHDALKWDIKKDSNGNEFPEETSGTDYEWTKIGSGSSSGRFAGIFDGQMHTISGIYAVANSQRYGLFADTAAGATVKNLKLTNSFFNGGTYNLVGSIAGATNGGTFENIYSDAVVKGDGENIGGMIGAKYGSDSFDINNCWFNGSVTKTSNKTCTAGVIARIDATGTYNVTNCLNTGTIRATYNGARYVGGIIGYSGSSRLNFSHSLNAGSVEQVTTQSSTRRNGLIAGYLAGVTYDDTYTITQEGFDIVVNEETDATKILNPNDISGMNALNKTPDLYSVKTVDGINKVYWAVTDETPILGDFIEFTKDGVDAVAFDTTWYDGSGNYTLYDASDLYGFAKLSKDKSEDFYEETIKLGADITIPNDGETEDWADEAPTFSWQSICPSTGFQGTFDGQGYEISGIYLHNTTTNENNGLFGKIGTQALVQKISLTDSYFYSSSNSLGSIAGVAKGTFDTIYSSATVRMSSTRVGGIIGTVDGEFVMNNCWFAGDVESSGTHHIGGLIGHIKTTENTTQTITNCLNTGDIVSTNASAKYVGGLIGYCEPRINVSNCLNTKALQYNPSKTATEYGLIAGKFSLRPTVIDGVYTISQDGMSYSNILPSNSYLVDGTDIIGETARQKMPKLFESQTGHGNNYWTITTGTPYLATFAKYAEETEAVVADTSWYNETRKEFTLRTADELTGLAQLVNEGNTFARKTIKLDSDIYINKGEATEWEDVSHLPIINIWTPIGLTSNTAFAGTFDGQGHTISGIYLNSDSEYLGMFGVLADNATIQNLRVVNSYFECTANSRSDDEHGLGSIAGQGTGTLYNVYSDAILVNASTNTGGLVGSVVQQETTLNVNNCWFTGTITGCEKDTTSENDWIGGIVGCAKNDVTINMSDCLVAADLTSDLTGESYVGGLSGRIFGGTIQSCMVLGTINCGEQGVASSIAGESAGLSIQGCYNATNRTDVTKGVIQFTNRGTGNYNIEFQDQNLSNYTSYCSALEDKKFSKYAENSTGNENDKVYNATYVRDEIVITVVFMEKTGEICISIEKDLPLSTHLLQAIAYSGAERANANTTLHMLKLSKDGTKVYGDSFVIQLKNGHFIVDDGGMECEAATLYNYLKTLTPNGEKPVIDAWFISHGHSDHIGALSAFAKNKTYYDNVYVNGVYFNEPSYTNSDYYRTAINNVSKFFRTSDDEITPVYRPKTGQRYYFDDITIDVLHTQEQLEIDEYTSDFNETSTWLSYTIDGSTFLHAGDAAENSVNRVLDHYDSSYLEFDVLATLHHAQNIYQNFLDNFKYNILLYTTWDTKPQKITLENMSLDDDMYDKAQHRYSWGNGTITLTFDRDNGIQLPDGNWFKK